ncbi:solute carrier family 15 member 2-like isoform X2 [Tubulanus polymorphus]|uniref:solute carrier family 15 member 2-like isoform X2 n=1 Tax=Tubulanus polymorphus TaxID=672921 RepID=UPI003DA3AE3F
MMENHDSDSASSTGSNGKPIDEGTRLLESGKTGNTSSAMSKDHLCDLDVARDPDDEIKEKKNCCQELSESCRDYPKPVFLILMTEFCERFSFYGMRTVLTLYLKNHLQFGAHAATEIFHAFNMLCYFTPIIGACIADGWIGKFKTITYLSIVYAVGNVIMSFTAFPLENRVPGPMVALLLIAIGTGGIKPCVSAFGGDQFEPSQERLLAQFFSIFYLAINAGSLISTFLTPIFREDVQCFGGDCYPLAFGVPALLMIIAIIFFVSGKNAYKITPPSGNIVGRFFMCIYRGITNKFTMSTIKRDSVLDYADDMYEKTFIEDVKAVLWVLLIFLPLPVFWALYDQQGSTWTLQAEQMDGDLGFMVLKPDQIQAINTILIIIFIPIFESCLYPLMTKCKMNRPLLKMVLGMALAALAFVMAGFVQISIDKTIVPQLQMGESRVKFSNVVQNCTMDIRSPFYISENPVPPLTDTPSILTTSGDVSLNITLHCPNGVDISKKNQVVHLGNNETTLMVSEPTAGNIVIQTLHDELTKPHKGLARVRVVYMIDDSIPDTVNRTMYYGDKYVFHGVKKSVPTEYISVDPIYKFKVPVYNGTHIINNRTIPVDPELGMGGVYTVIILTNSLATFTDVNPNKISMLLQIPQYVIITIGEIFFSVTGLSFAYSEAPKTMKSVLMAVWLLTIAIGNLIVLLFEMTSMSHGSVQFFVFAVLMGVDILMFGVLAIFYNRRKSGRATAYSSSELKNTDDTPHAKDNPMFDGSEKPSFEVGGSEMESSDL